MSRSNFSASKFLLINTTLKSLHLYIRNQLQKSYPVAVGTPLTPTPKGQYKVVTKIYNPGGILGTRWLGLSVPEGNYGIHGTNALSPIGKDVTNGCIRLYNEHIEELFSLVNIGTPVHITTVDDDYTLPNNNFAAPSPQEQNWYEENWNEEAEEPWVEEPWTERPQFEEFPKDEYVEQNDPVSQPEDQLPSPEGSDGVTYIVKPGDTLWTIARRFGLPVQRIIEHNSFINPNMIFPGQSIYIPPRNNKHPY